MKNLETLIQELCPDGVEFVKIGEVAKVGTGSSNRQDAVDNGKYPFYVRSKNILASDTYEFDDESIIIPGEGGIGEIFHYVKGKYALHQRVYRINFYDERINVKFVYYYMYSCFKRFIMKKAVSATVTSIRKPMIEKFEIPLPPIEVQTEIVRILDKFTSLEAELKAELDCRKRQYEYYRDKLLSFENVGGQEVEWKKMSEVSFYPKTRIDASELSDNSYIGVENLLKDKLGRTDSTVKPEGSVIQFVEKDILIGNIRPYLRKIWKSDCKGGTNGDVLCIRVKEPSEVSADYLFHILSSEKFFLYDIKNSKGAKMPRGDKSAVMDFEIPIPSLDEQNRIVSILDRFESLTTSLQSGLPAEIAARRQQYEHYRDKLLTFKRKGAA